MFALRHAAIAAALVLPAALHAQHPVRWASASVAVTAHVAPVLTIAGTGTAQAVVGDAEPAWASLVSVRANVAHRVLVRPAGGAVVALRAPDGQWVLASASVPMEFIGTLGNRAHRVECRGDAAVCALTYELRSTDARFRMRATAGPQAPALTPAVATIATTS